MSANITLPPKSISYGHSTSYDLVVTMIQKTHDLGGYDMTPNTITQTSVKVAMTSRFLGLVGSLPPDEQNEQNLWIPNQVVHDPDTWTTSDVDVPWKRSRCKTLLIPPLIFSYYRRNRLSTVFTRSLYEFRRYLNLGILDRFCRRLNTPCTDHEQIMRNCRLNAPDLYRS